MGDCENGGIGVEVWEVYVDGVWFMGGGVGFEGVGWKEVGGLKVWVWMRGVVSGGVIVGEGEGGGGGGVGFWVGVFKGGGLW